MCRRYRPRGTLGISPRVLKYEYSSFTSPNREARAVRAIFSSVTPPMTASTSDDSGIFNFNARNLSNLVKQYSPKSCPSCVS
jgi:hypothetical protein